MRSAVKIIGGLLAVLLVLLVGLGIWLSTMDLNHYKPQLTKALSARLNRAVQLNGEMHLTLWPQLAVQLNDVQIANADWGNDQPLAKLKQLSAKVDLMALLQREVIVQAIDLQTGTINLQQKGDQQNWQLDFAKAVKPAEVAARQANTPSEAQAIKQAPFILELQKLSLDNVVFNYQKDSAKPIIFQIDNSSVNLSPTAPLALNIKGQYLNQPINLALTSSKALLPMLAAQADAAPLQLIASLGGNSVNFNGEGSHLKNAPAFKGKLDVKINDWATINAFMVAPLPFHDALSVQTQIVKATKDAADLQDLKINLGATTATGALLIGWQPNLNVKGNLNIPEFDLALLQPPNANTTAQNPPTTKQQPSAAVTSNPIPDIAIPYDAFHNYQMDINLQLGTLKQAEKILIDQASGHLQIGADVMQLNKVAFHFAQQPLQGNLILDGHHQSVAADLNSERLETAAILQALQLPQILQTQLNGSLNFKGSGARLPQVLATSGGNLNITMAGGKFDETTLGLLGVVALEMIAPMVQDLPKQIALNCGQLMLNGTSGFWQLHGALDSPSLANIQQGRIDLAHQQIQATLSSHLKIAKVKAGLPNVLVSGNLFAPRVEVQPLQSIRTVLGQFIKGVQSQSAIGKLYQDKPDITGPAACQALMGLDTSTPATTPQNALQNTMQNLLQQKQQPLENADPNKPTQKPKTKDLLIQGLQQFLSQ